MNTFEDHSKGSIVTLKSMEDCEAEAIKLMDQFPRKKLMIENQLWNLANIYDFIPKKVEVYSIKSKSHGIFAFVPGIIKHEMSAEEKSTFLFFLPVFSFTEGEHV